MSRSQIIKIRQEKIEMVACDVTGCKVEKEASTFFIRPCYVCGCDVCKKCGKLFKVLEYEEATFFNRGETENNIYLVCLNCFNQNKKLFIAYSTKQQKKFVDTFGHI